MKSRRKHQSILSILVISLLFLSVVYFSQPTKNVSAASNILDVSRWTKNSNNPVLTASQGWESNYVSRPVVINTGSQYLMYYTGNTVPSVQVGLATSFDGVHWTEYASNPILSPGTAGSWDEQRVYHVAVIKDGSTYKMWYSGQNLAAQRQIGYATSSDGIHWTKYSPNPVLSGSGTPSAWDYGGIREPSVVKLGSTYYMWYAGWDGSSFGTSGAALWKIGLATSSDGIGWTKSASNPVLTASVSGWDSEEVYSPSVVYDTSSSTYHMWYSGGAGSGSPYAWLIGHASSSNGVSWTKDTGNPVLGPGPSGAWDNATTEYDTDYAGALQVGSQYWIYYSGYGTVGGVGPQYRIGLAVTGYPYMPYQTIQSAVNAATAGKTILVHDGLYNEQVIIGSAHSGITIQPGSTATLDGTGVNLTQITNNEGVTYSGGIILEDATGVTIKNMIIQNFIGTSGQYPGGILLVDASNNIIQGNTIQYDRSGVIFTDNSNHNSITSNTIHDNHWESPTLWYIGGNGIDYWYGNCSFNTIQNNVIYNHDRNGILVGEHETYNPSYTEGLGGHGGWLITGNNVHDNGWYGIEITNGQNSQITGNTVTNTGYYGVLLRAWNHTESGITVQGNTVSNSGYRGIYARAEPTGDNLNGLNINGNNVYNSASYDGIRLRGIYGGQVTNSFVVNNLAHNNGADGIALDATFGTMVTTNTVWKNTGYGIDVYASSSNNQINHNTIKIDGLTAKDDGTNNQWNTTTEGNYWSNYAGVDANKDGIGDTPYAIGGTAGSSDWKPLMGPAYTGLTVGTPQYFSSPNLYINSNTPITLSTSKISAAGAITTKYKVDSGSLNTYTSPFTVSTAYLDGQHTISFYSQDTNGNLEPTRNFNIILDNLPPQSGGNYNNDTGVLTLVASDSGSGVQTISYQINGGAWQTYSTPITVLQADSSTTVLCRSTDNVANTETAKTCLYLVGKQQPPPLPTFTGFEVLLLILPLLTLSIATRAKRKSNP